jgi:hypothetical protein
LSSGLDSRSISIDHSRLGSSSKQSLPWNTIPQTRLEGRFLVFLYMYSIGSCRACKIFTVSSWHFALCVLSDWDCYYSHTQWFVLLLYLIGIIFHCICF